MQYAELPRTRTKTTMSLSFCIIKGHRGIAREDFITRLPADMERSWNPDLAEAMAELSPARIILPDHNILAYHSIQPDHSSYLSWKRIKVKVLGSP